MVPGINPTCLFRDWVLMGSGPPTVPNKHFEFYSATSILPGRRHRTRRLSKLFTIIYGFIGVCRLSTNSLAVNGFGRTGKKHLEILSIGTFSLVLSIVGCFIGCVSEQRERERDLILSLPWQQFDQTPNSGWRIYFARHEYRATADLIEIYLKQHQDLTVRQRAVSNFHAGQMRLHADGPKVPSPT